MKTREIIEKLEWRLEVIDGVSDAFAGTDDYEVSKAAMAGYTQALRYAIELFKEEQGKEEEAVKYVQTLNRRFERIAADDERRARNAAAEAIAAENVLDLLGIEY